MSEERNIRPRFNCSFIIAIILATKLCFSYLGAGILFALIGKLHPFLQFLFNSAWFSAAIVSFGIYYFLMNRNVPRTFEVRGT